MKNSIEARIGLVQSRRMTAVKEKAVVHVVVYTDGACSGNPGPGGWAAIVGFKRGVHATIYEIGGGARHTTNNKMEMQAAIEAMTCVKARSMQWLSKHPHFPGVRVQGRIYTDSKYVVQGLNEWCLNWEKNNWRTADKKPVANQEEWQRLLALKRELAELEIHHVRGHEGVLGNERCDEIAVAYSRGSPDDVELFQGKSEDYLFDLFEESL